MTSPIDRGRHRRGTTNRPRRHTVQDETSLSGIRRLIRSEMSRVGVDPAASFDCLVAVTEACSNALLHGKADAVPQISWKIEQGFAHFLIEDYSTRQWSKSDHPSRAAELPYEAAARIGGFGIELMEGLMDEVDIRAGPGGTTVSLSKRLA